MSGSGSDRDSETSSLLGHTHSVRTGSYGSQATESQSQSLHGERQRQDIAKKGIKKLKAALKRHRDKAKGFTVGAPLDVHAPLLEDRPRSAVTPHQNLLNTYQRDGKKARPYAPGSEQGAAGDTEAHDREPSCWALLATHFQREYADSSVVRSLCSPSGYRRRQWHVLVFLSIVYNTITVPLRVGFVDTIYRDYEHAGWWFGLTDAISDSIFYMHILLGFYTPYNDSGFYVTDKSLIWKHYLMNRFGVHFLASTPIYYGHLRVHMLLRVPRMIWWIEVRACVYVYVCYLL
jgi:hypothetical protein